MFTTSSASVNFMERMNIRFTEFISIRFTEFISISIRFTEFISISMYNGGGRGGRRGSNSCSIFISQQTILDSGFTEGQIEAGHVFLEFISIGDASEVIRRMQNRKYDGRFLRFSSFPEDR